MRRPPLDSPLDLAVAALVAAHLLFSLASAAFVLHFHLFGSSVSRRRRRLLGLNSLWPVRLLLVLFGSLWSSTELLRLPILPLIPPSALICRAYSLSSQSFAEPCFFATLLFLLRSSTLQPKPISSSAFAAALASAITAAIPFLLVHALFLALSPWALRLLRLPQDVSYATSSAAHTRCTYPLFGTVLLAALGSVYVPLFLSACWGAVTVVINKQLRIRLYLLAAAVVVALSVQVSALALSALWAPGGAASQGLALAAFVAVLSCVAAGEGILVVQPVVDALAIVDPGPGSGCGKDGRSTCAVHASVDG